MNERLMEALLYAALFFETSSDDQCDPDSAVTQLEAIGARLCDLSPAEQDEFQAFARKEAERQPDRAVAGEILTLVDGLFEAE